MARLDRPRPAGNRFGGVDDGQVDVRPRGERVEERRPVRRRLGGNDGDPKLACHARRRGLRHLSARAERGRRLRGAVRRGARRPRRRGARAHLRGSRPRARRGERRRDGSPGDRRVDAVGGRTGDASEGERAAAERGCRRRPRPLSGLRSAGTLPASRGDRPAPVAARDDVLEPRPRAPFAASDQARGARAARPEHRPLEPRPRLPGRDPAHRRARQAGALAAGRHEHRRWRPAARRMRSAASSASAKGRCSATSASSTSPAASRTCSRRSRSSAAEAATRAWS